MMRYLEYAYLLAAIAIAVFMAVTFKELPTSNKVMLALGGMLCAFMFSFRRKQRIMLEEYDREQAEGDTEEPNPDADER
jgi:hypothetical protein